MAYMEGEEPTVEQIKACIRKGTRDLAFFPTFCGSAFKTKVCSYFWMQLLTTFSNRS